MCLCDNRRKERGRQRSKTRGGSWMMTDGNSSISRYAHTSVCIHMYTLLHFWKEDIKIVLSENMWGAWPKSFPVLSKSVHNIHSESRFLHSLISCPLIHQHLLLFNTFMCLVVVCAHVSSLPVISTLGRQMLTTVWISSRKEIHQFPDSVHEWKSA